jgi:tetratricopeptide (TPR) repeat protein
MDSLRQRLALARHDTDKLRELSAIANICDLEEVEKYAAPVIQLADKILQSRDLSRAARSWVLIQKGNAVNGKAYYYHRKGDLARGLESYNQCVEIYEEGGDRQGIAISLNSIAMIHEAQGDIPAALDFYSKSLKIQQETGDSLGISYSYSNLASVYSGQGDYALATDYYLKCLQIREKLGHKIGIASALNSLGTMYENTGNREKGMEYYKKSLELYKKTGDKVGVGTLLNNIGGVYYSRRILDSALSTYFNGLEVFRQIQYREGMSFVLKNIGAAYLLAGYNSSGARKAASLALAFKYCDSSLSISKEAGLAENIRNAEETMAKVDSARGNFDGALIHYKQYIIFRDSIKNFENRKATIRNELKYEYEKKEAVLLEKQEKERAVSEEQQSRQMIAIWAVALGLLLVGVFAVFIFRTLKLTRHQKAIIEERQKEILDSIYYAKRIQHSLLPPEKYIQKTLARMSKDD